MAEIRHPEPVKLIVGLLSAYPGALAEVESDLMDRLGPVDLRSDLIAHEFTEYYRDEMGHPLVRLFLAFEPLSDPGELARVKILTNDLERRLAASGQWPVLRPVNIDPGYLTPAKLVLASCKDFSHRVYLGGGIYAEPTLRYLAGHWQAHEWTYPDFKTPGYQDFLTAVRERLLIQKKELRAGLDRKPPDAGTSQDQERPKS